MRLYEFRYIHPPKLFGDGGSAQALGAPPPAVAIPAIPQLISVDDLASGLLVCDHGRDRKVVDLDGVERRSKAHMTILKMRRETLHAKREKPDMSFRRAASLSGRSAPLPQNHAARHTFVRSLSGQWASFGLGSAISFMLVWDSMVWLAGVETKPGHGRYCFSMEFHDAAQGGPPRDGFGNFF